MRKLVFVLCFIPAWAFAQPEPAPPAQVPPNAHDMCVAAMNADPMFANSIIKVANEQTYATHLKAAERVKTNEQHVILAYAAMWVVAAIFLLFLWRRQQLLKGEISRLRRDLETATKEPAK